ncbi:MAG: hypothetical protein ACI4L9_05110 [Candidatus Coproplasma sp.]
MGELSSLVGNSSRSPYNYGNSYQNSGYSQGYSYGGSGSYSYGGNSRSGYGRTERTYGYEAGSAGRGKGLYSSDEGYESDLPFSVSSSYGSERKKPVSQGKPAEHKQQFTPFSGFNQSKPAASKHYTVGTKVKHPKFGIGTVIAVKNGGAVINVAFDGQGIKELSASLAPLEII